MAAHKIAAAERMNMADRVVIASACRTAVGKMGGALSTTPAAELGAIVIKEAVKRAGIKPEDVDQVLGLTYAVCRGFVQEQTYVRLLWWSQGKYAFVEKQIMNQENLKEAFSEIYYEKTYGDDLEIRSLMQSIHPELKAYAQISMKNGQADAEVVEQD